MHNQRNQKMSNTNRTAPTEVKETFPMHAQQPQKPAVRDKKQTTYRNGLTLGVAVLLACTLSGCATWDKLDRTERGAVIGTGGGAVIGAAVGGTTGAVIGGVGGGVAGGVIGHNTDD